MAVIEICIGGTIMNNCPNCGAPLEPYKCKCEYCGTWYFDFTAFDMTDDKPYYVKFRTPYGIITTLARPELQTIEAGRDEVDVTTPFGMTIDSFIRSCYCDLGVVFHSQANPANGTFYTLEVKDYEN